MADGGGLSSIYVMPGGSAPGIDDPRDLTQAMMNRI
jgi:hypothetical protein